LIPSLNKFNNLKVIIIVKLIINKILSSVRKLKNKKNKGEIKLNNILIPLMMGENLLEGTCIEKPSLKELMMILMEILLINLTIFLTYKKFMVKLNNLF
jgi:hypothetical protein